MCKDTKKWPVKLQFYRLKPAPWHRGTVAPLSVVDPTPANCTARIFVHPLPPPLKDSTVRHLTASWIWITMDHLCNGLVSTCVHNGQVFTLIHFGNPQHLIGRRRWLQSLIFEDTEKMQGILASKCRPTGDAQRVAHDKRSMSSLDSYITSYHIYILYRIYDSIYVKISFYVICHQNISKLHSDVLCVLRAPTSSTIPQQPLSWKIVDLPELLEAQFGKELAAKEGCSGRLEVTMNYSETTVPSGKLT